MLCVEESDEESDLTTTEILTEEIEKQVRISFVKTIGLIIFGVLLILGIGFILFQYFKHEDEIASWRESSISSGKTLEDDEICNTPKCTIHSAFLLSSMNPKIDPCHDFYEHVCGKVVENHLVDLDDPEDQSSMSQVDKIIDNIVRQILESNEIMSKSEKSMKMIMNRCLDKGRIEQDGSKYAIQKLRKFGKWPILDENWNEDDFDLTDILIKFGKSSYNKFGIFHFANHYVDNADSRIVITRPSQLSQLVVKGMTNGLKMSKEDLDDVAKFQATLFEKSEDEGVSKLQLELMSIRKLQLHVPHLNWTRFINSLVPEVYQNELKNFFIAERNSFFQQQLPSLLNRTRPRIIANFLMLNWLKSREIYISHDSSKTAEAEHRKYCYQIISDGLPTSLGMSYVYRYITDQNIFGAHQMVSAIQESFKGVLQKATWMGEASQKEAIRKIAELKRVIGFPEKYKNSEDLDNFHKDLAISESDSFFEMVEKLEEWNIRNHYIELVKTGAFLDYVLFHKVNAQYSDLTNKINIFAPFLRFPFYDMDLPAYANYGSLGQTIGHEIAHGFDTSAIRHEPIIGKYKVFEKMQPGDDKRFNNSVECFKKAYNSYKHPPFLDQTALECDQSIDENLADNIGMKVTYQAFKKLETEGGNKWKRLPGFQKTTNDQLFFYAFARVYCDIPLSRQRFEAMKNSAYSPNRFRVNGVAKNSEEFANAFNCKKDDPMNPKNKCSVF